MDRRTSLKWMLAASGSLPLLKQLPAARAANHSSTDKHATKGYGSDPNLLKTYKPGELWPLTFNAEQRRTAAVLCDLIIPADEESPSASSIGVVDFIDEWISAPYKPQRKDRKTVLDGLKWLEHASRKRFGKGFTQIDDKQRHAICDDICYAEKAKKEHADAAKFFATYRDLTAGGFYTSPQGRIDIKYVGNVPLKSFDGPPLAVLKQVGLA